MSTTPSRAHGARPRLVGRLALLSCLATAAACGDSTGTGTGSFTATVTGATDKSYAGQALVLRQAGFGYALLLDSDATIGPNQFELVLSRENTAIPGTGTHDIVDLEGVVEPTPDQFVGAVTMSAEEPEERYCHSVSGSLTFTSSSSGRAAGSFEVTISCVLTSDPEGTPEEATIEGTFDAVSAQSLGRRSAALREGRRAGAPPLAAILAATVLSSASRA